MTERSDRLVVSFDADIDQRIEFLRAVWLFSACDDDELSRIAALSPAA